MEQEKAAKIIILPCFISEQNILIISITTKCFVIRKEKKNLYSFPSPSLSVLPELAVLL